MQPRAPPTGADRKGVKDAEDTAANRRARLDRRRDHEGRARGMGDRRRWLGVRLGAAGRRGVDRGDPSGARARDQLDRHRRRLRVRSLRGGRRPGARRASSERPYVFTKASLLEGPGRKVAAQPAARLDPAARRRRASRAWASTRSTSTRSTGRFPRRTSRRAGRRCAELKERGSRASHRRLQLQCRADAPDQLDRADRDPPAAVLADRARGGAGDPALCRGAGHRRDRLLADGLRPADRGDDPRAHREPADGRLAQGRQALPRAAAGPSPRRWPSGWAQSPRGSA